MIDSKNRILSQSCYGPVIDINRIEEVCKFPQGMIKGYSIEILKYDNCSDVNQMWTHKFSDEDGEHHPYLVPIEVNGIVCPGKLRVIY